MVGPRAAEISQCANDPGKPARACFWRLRRRGSSGRVSRPCWRWLYRGSAAHRQARSSPCWPRRLGHDPSPSQCGLSTGDGVWSGIGSLVWFEKRGQCRGFSPCTLPPLPRGWPSEYRLNWRDARVARPAVGGRRAAGVDRRAYRGVPESAQPFLYIRKELSAKPRNS